MHIYDARTFFNTPEVGAEELAEFLSELGDQKGWDEQQIELHLRYAIHTRLRYGTRLAIKYLESLL